MSQLSQIDGLCSPRSRFVDRDMFMRYRGGGVSHKYMREVKTRCENMSLERIHGKPHSGSSPNANANVGGVTGSDEGPGALDQLRASNNDESGSDDEDHTPLSTSDAADGGYSTSCNIDSANNEDLTGDTLDPAVLNEDPTNDEDLAVGDNDSDSDHGSVDVEADFDEVGSDGGYKSFGLAEF